MLCVCARVSLLHHATTACAAAVLPRHCAHHNSWLITFSSHVCLPTPCFAHAVAGSEVRSDFVLPAGTVARAKAYTSGVGLFELHINGAKVADHYLDPGEAVYVNHKVYHRSPSSKWCQNESGFEMYVFFPSRING